MNVLVTGSDGFIGMNLIVRLKELNIGTITYTRKNKVQDFEKLLKNADCVVHLAAVNRPKDEKQFDIVNSDLTKSICNALRKLGKNIPLIFTSSVQVCLNNAYGKSKLDAEVSLKSLQMDIGSRIYIYRLPGVFGKWSKPNYNSVVATFCYNISQNLPIHINEPSYELTLVYIDDLIDEFINLIKGKNNFTNYPLIKPQYKITLEDLANQIKKFKESRTSLITEKVGSGLVRKLYSTYISYLSPKQFTYSIPYYNDKRGIFAEMIKTKDSGQFSFFTAGPGITRGGHYHHSKSEKFLILQGKAKFCFKNVISKERYEIVVNSKNLKIIETIPGWAHDITNIGDDEMIVMLWANEIFDHQKPDTKTYKMNK